MERMKLHNYKKIWSYIISAIQGKVWLHVCRYLLRLLVRRSAGRKDNTFTMKHRLAFISTVCFENVILFSGRQKNNFPYST